MLADWRGAYYRGTELNFCKCFVTNESSVDFVLDLVENNSGIETVYIVPYNLMLFVNGEDADIKIENLFENYVADKGGSKTYNTIERIKNDGILENDKLRLFFEAHVYPVNIRAIFKKHAQITPLLRGAHVCPVTYCMHQIYGLLSFRITNLKIYKYEPDVLKTLAMYSDKPYDDPFPLIDVTDVPENYADFDDQYKFEGDVFAHIHNVCNCKIPNEEIFLLRDDFMMSDSIIHKLLYDMFSSKAHDMEFVNHNRSVFVCNINLMTQLTTAKTEFDNQPRSTDKQVDYIFDNIVSEYCTVHDILLDKTISTLLEKDYIFFPVHYSSPRYQHNKHWALYMCHRPFDPLMRTPLIYCIDSLFDVDTKHGVIPFVEHAINMLKLRFYLLRVADKYGQSIGGRDSICSSRIATCIRTPQQPMRSNACGLYVFLFIDYFMRKTFDEKAELMKAIVASLQNRNVIMASDFEIVNANTINTIKQEVVDIFEKHYNIPAKANKRVRFTINNNDNNNNNNNKKVWSK